MDKTDILQDISVDFSQLVKKHIKNIKKLDGPTQKEFGRAFGDMKDLLDDLSESALKEAFETAYQTPTIQVESSTRIKLGDLLKEDEDTMVKNPETGRQIKAASAISAGPDHPAYKAAIKATGGSDSEDEEVDTEEIEEQIEELEVALEEAIDELRDERKRFDSIENDYKRGVRQMYRDLKDDGEDPSSAEEQYRDIYDDEAEEYDAGKQEYERLQQRVKDIKDEIAELKSKLDENLVNEDLGDVLRGVGSVLKGAGQGVASILNVLIGGIVAMGVLIMVGAAGAIGGITTLLGFAGAGMVSLIKKFVYIPAIEATLKRLSEDKEVMAIAKKPTAKGLRTIAEKKLTKAERVLVGKWIKSNITRRQLGIGRGGRKTKSGPGLDKFDKSFMTDF